MSPIDMPEQSFRSHVLASLHRVEHGISALGRALNVDTSAIKTLIAMENNQMTTLADILAKAQALSAADASAQINQQHLLDAANAHVADLEQKLAGAQAAAVPVDPAVLDSIAAELDKAKVIADAMSAGAAPVAPVAAAPVAEAPAPVEPAPAAEAAPAAPAAS